MLVQMENEWRVPETKDYQRMCARRCTPYCLQARAALEPLLALHGRYQQFKWNQHAEGKARCLKGLWQDLRRAGEEGTPVDQVEPEMIAGLFRLAQERQQPDEVIRLADSLQKAQVKLDRFQHVRATATYARTKPGAPIRQAIRTIGRSASSSHI